MLKRVESGFTGRRVCSLDAIPLREQHALPMHHNHRQARRLRAAHVRCERRVRESLHVIAGEWRRRRRGWSCGSTLRQLRDDRTRDTEDSEEEGECRAGQLASGRVRRVLRPNAPAERGARERDDDRRDERVPHVAVVIRVGVREAEECGDEGNAEPGDEPPTPRGARDGGTERIATGQEEDDVGETAVARQVNRRGGEPEGERGGEHASVGNAAAEGVECRGEDESGRRGDAELEPLPARFQRGDLRGDRVTPDAMLLGEDGGRGPYEPQGTASRPPRITQASRRERLVIT